MPTRFKYTRSKPTAFGLTPAEILLATDKELDAIAGLRHIAPYRKQGLGMQGRGISKRIYDLKQKLKERKWGEEMEADEDGKPRTMSRDAGWSGKRKASGEDKEESGEGTRKKKRLGKSQRKREREAKGWVAPESGEAASASTATTSGNRFEAPEQPEQAEEVVAPTAAGEGEKEGKKRRKKKSSQKQEELKIFD
jgi:protein KRI1